MRLAILGATTLFALTSPAFAQTASAPSAPAASNSAYAADVASMDAIVAALYASISGDAGVARDWDRFRNLFHPSARLMPTGTDAQGPGTLRPLTPQDYVDRAGPGLVRDGFHEQEIARRTDRYGRIAHLFSTYDARRAATDPGPSCAASTPSSCSTTATAGGSSASTGRPKPPTCPCPPPICQRRTERWPRPAPPSPTSP